MPDFLTVAADLGALIVWNGSKLADGTPLDVYGTPDAPLTSDPLGWDTIRGGPTEADYYREPLGTILGSGQDYSIVCAANANGDTSDFARFVQLTSSGSIATHGFLAVGTARGTANDASSGVDYISKPRNSWHLWGMSFDNGTETVAYLDGARNGNGSASLVTTNGSLAALGTGFFANRMGGDISCGAVFDRALSDSEMLQLYEAYQNGPPPEWVYQTSLIGPTGPEGPPGTGGGSAVVEGTEEPPDLEPGGLWWDSDDYAAYPEASGSGQTSLGLTYPTGPDSLWGHFQTLAEDTDNALLDIGLTRYVTPSWRQDDGTILDGGLGNGSLGLRYVNLGTIVICLFEFTRGDTTWQGTGPYQWKLPGNSNSYKQVAGVGMHNQGGAYSPLGVASPGSGWFRLITTDGQRVDRNNPKTAQTGDVISALIVYWGPRP